MKNKEKGFTSIRYSGLTRFVDNLRPFIRIIPFVRIFLKNVKKIRNPFKIFKIKKYQDKLLSKNYSTNTKKLIIFLTPGYDIINGGIHSISSIYEETIKLKHIHGAEVIMCTIPGDPLLLKYTKFDNQNYIYRFSQILPYFKNLQNLIIHIPEYSCNDFIKHCSKEEYSKINKLFDVHINIMLQNIDLSPNKSSIEKLGRFGKLTCTTAHEKYSTHEMRNELGLPLHKLSTFVSPEQYRKKNYFEKENLMIVSPDYHPTKPKILDLIAKEFPQLKIQIIKNLTYEEYKKTISHAKWSLTFGEGLDGYFVESIFSGGISFSVFNPNYFTQDFQELRTVYSDYTVLMEKICNDIKNLDNEVMYLDYHKKQYDLVCKYYHYDEYINNLVLFYEGQYTYT
ncbi:hypothetical protein MSKOL_0791 [Methanosarcina sp. Kolksee]|uniref:hypothetical protein n=1 Tax=Methanosarcina sp. Kolksee TaxID=1434099 RepID=UPI0006154F52|nr:hypothetical protein [Methanosarcina sp. Kolksee]AKB46568.1 hypothetical protein MSKOL_0791 [Methanosarcina sp. Kolksee]